MLPGSRAPRPAGRMRRSELAEQGLLAGRLGKAARWARRSRRSVEADAKEALRRGKGHKHTRHLRVLVGQKEYTTGLGERLLAKVRQEELVLPELQVCLTPGQRVALAAGIARPEGGWGGQRMTPRREGTVFSVHNFRAETSFLIDFNDRKIWLTRSELTPVKEPNKTSKKASRSPGKLSSISLPELSPHARSMRTPPRRRRGKGASKASPVDEPVDEPNPVMEKVLDESTETRRRRGLKWSTG